VREGASSSEFKLQLAATRKQQPKG